MRDTDAYANDRSAPRLDEFSAAAGGAPTPIRHEYANARRASMDLLSDGFAKAPPRIIVSLTPSCLSLTSSRSRMATSSATSCQRDITSALSRARILLSVRGVDGTVRASFRRPSRA
jgi:hypothetical protein